MKKGIVYNYHMEILTWQQQNSVLLIFHKAKINEFYKEYGGRIDTIVADITALQRKHMEFDAEGKIKMHGELNNLKPVFLEGHTEVDLNEEFQQLMMQDITDKGIHVVKSLLDMNGKPIN